MDKYYYFAYEFYVKEKRIVGFGTQSNKIGMFGYAAAIKWLYKHRNTNNAMITFVQEISSDDYEELNKLLSEKNNK